MKPSVLNEKPGRSEVPAATGWPKRGDRVNNQIPGSTSRQEPGSRGNGMCGRFASARKRIELLEEFGVQRDDVDEDLRPDYNVAPTKPVYAVLTRHSHEKEAGEGKHGEPDDVAQRRLRV